MNENRLEIQFFRFDNTENMSEFIFEKFVNPVGCLDFIIPGGKSIHPLYYFLNERHKLLMDKNFYLSDERMDGAESTFSNQNNLRNLYPELGKKTSGFNDPNYNEKIKTLLHKRYISILGVGEDGHIASLFPEDPYFKNDNLIHNFKKAEENFTRYSLAFNLLLRSTELIFWICGATKKNLIEMIKEKDYTKPFVNLIIEYNNLSFKPIIVSDQNFAYNE